VVFSWPAGHFAPNTQNASCCGRAINRTLNNFLYLATLKERSPKSWIQQLGIGQMDSPVLGS
jgi:hypothetical protein